MSRQHGIEESKLDGNQVEQVGPIEEGQQQAEKGPMDKPGEAGATPASDQDLRNTDQAMRKGVPGSKEEGATRVIPMDEGKNDEGAALPSTIVSSLHVGSVGQINRGTSSERCCG